MSNFLGPVAQLEVHGSETRDAGIEQELLSACLFAEWYASYAPHVSRTERLLKVPYSSRGISTERSHARESLTLVAWNLRVEIKPPRHGSKLKVSVIIFHVDSFSYPHKIWLEPH